MATTWINRGHLYAPHVTPIIADCRFTVTPTNGLGITALKGQAATNVFMHTSTTPTRGPNGYLNPNPAAGLIMVQLADNYTQLYAVTATIHGPNTGSNIAVDASDALLTAGVLYVITVVGTTTLAQWRTLGVPAGITPAVGVSFIALVTGAGAGSGQVQLPATAGSAIDHVELVGDPTLMLGPVPVGGSPNVGAIIMLRTMAKASNVNAQAAPATGSVIRLAFYLNQSSVQVAGE